MEKISALVFDLIGTTTDWHTPVATTLRAHASQHASLASRDIDWDAFAHEWRKSFFAYVANLAKQGKERPINEVYQNTLNDLMQRHNITEWDSAQQQDLIKSWALMEAWKDTVPGLDALRRKYAVAVLSNGSSRTLIDSNKRNGMIFDIILTSNIVGHYKPNPEMYQAAQSALQYEPHEIAMVAAHEYDLDAAAKAGFHTIYIERHTEDLGIDRETFKRFDMVINEGGLAELARRLGALE